MSSVDNTKSTIPSTSQTQPSNHPPSGLSPPIEHTSNAKPSILDTQHGSTQHGTTQQQSETANEPEPQERQRDRAEIVNTPIGEDINDSKLVDTAKTEDANESNGGALIMDVKRDQSGDMAPSKPVEKSAEAPSTHLLDMQPEWNEKQSYEQQRSSGASPNLEHEFDEKQKEANER